MKMTFDAEACAANIRLSSGASTVADSWPIEEFIVGIDDVILDLDHNRHVLGLELLVKQGHGIEAILAAIADGSLADALASEGFDCPQLRGNPDITVQNIG